MRDYGIQRNSLIVRKIGNSGKTSSLPRRQASNRGFLGVLSRFRGLAALAILTGLAALQSGERPAMSFSHSSLTSQNAGLQKADLIDDIIDAINNILNPPGSGCDPKP